MTIVSFGVENWKIMPPPNYVDNSWS